MGWREGCEERGEFGEELSVGWRLSEEDRGGEDGLDEREGGGFVRVGLFLDENENENSTAVSQHEVSMAKPS